MYGDPLEPVIGSVGVDFDLSCAGDEGFRVFEQSVRLSPMRRDRFFSHLVCLACIACFGGTARSAPPTVTMAFVGDIMVAETPGEIIEQGGDPFAPFAAFLATHDLRVGNLECAVATTGTPAIKPFTFRAHPRVLPVLAKHFDGFTIANNHSKDFGREAFSEQLRLMHDAALPFFGGGATLKEAHQPWIVERHGIRIALLGYDEFKPRSFEAGANYPGIAWGGEDEQVLTDIVAARTQYHADLVIPFMHWGWEEEVDPCERQREFARKMIDAGADLVVGSHPHVTQGAEYYKGRLILYSLGNFVFNGFETEATTTGWVLSVTMSKSGLIDWHTRVARLDAKGVPVPNLEAASPCGTASVPAVQLCKAGTR